MPPWFYLLGITNGEYLMDGCLHWLTDHKPMILGTHCEGWPGYHTTVGAHLLQPASRETSLSFQTDFVFITLYQMDGQTILQLLPKSTLYIKFCPWTDTRSLNGSITKTMLRRQKNWEFFILLSAIFSSEPYLLASTQPLKTEFSSESWNWHLTEIPSPAVSLVSTSNHFSITPSNWCLSEPSSDLQPCADQLPILRQEKREKCVSPRS